MYRIKWPDNRTLQNHYDFFAPIVLSSIDEYLTGKVLSHTIPRSITVSIKIKSGEETESVLKLFKDPDVLRILICGSLEDMVSLVCLLNRRIPSDANREPMKKSRYDNGDYLKYIETGETYIDHFYTIIKDIFVSIYDNSEFKLAFCKQHNLRHCPYCGMGETAVGHSPDVTTKPPIDHFLPKSVYPFFSVNYFNLIPCCSICNDLSHKAENNPLDGSLTKWYMMNPYGFDSSQIVYNLKCDQEPGLYADDYELDPNYAQEGWYVGYERWLGIYSRYKNYYKDDLAPMLERIRSIGPALRQYHLRYGMPVSAIDDQELSIVGFHLNDEEAHRHVRYKLIKDMYISLLSMYGPAISATFSKKK